MAVNIVSCFPGSHKLPSFIFKTISAKYTTWKTRSSLILLGKNGGPWTHTSAFPWDNCHTFVCSRRALNVLPISSQNIKKTCTQGLRFNEINIFTTSPRTVLNETAFFSPCTWILVKNTIIISIVCFHSLNLCYGIIALAQSMLVSAQWKGK